MSAFRRNIPTVLLVLFEAAVGVLLFRNPRAFTRTVIILFGLILLAIGVSYLLRYFTAKKEGSAGPLMLVVAIAALAVGAYCTFFSNAIIGLIAAMALIYGIILLLAGIYKLCNYFQARKLDFPVSNVSLISGVITVILGILITAYPVGAAVSIWKILGCVLIVEAVVDLIAIIQTVRISRQ